MDDVFDKIESLAPPPELLAGNQRPAKRKRFTADFVKLPMVWVKRLEAAKLTTTYRLAIFLQYRNWRRPGEPITVSNVAVNEWGVERRSKYLALTRIGKA
jgi:hypothetical protein